MKTNTVRQQIEREYHVSWVIIGYKLAFGLLELLSGAGIAIFGRQIGIFYTVHVTRELSEDPHDFLAHLSEAIVPNVLAHHTFLAIYLILLGAAKIAGAVGLLYRKNWGVDLLVGLTILMIPFQLVDLVRHASVLAMLYFGIGLLIALYLVHFKPKAWISRIMLKVRTLSPNHRV